MATMGVDGLVSGLNTTDLINSLMKVEAISQNGLKTQQTTVKSLVSGLQALNTKVASLAQTAAKVAEPKSWDAWKATTSEASVTATTTAGAQASSISFSVDRLATNQVTLSAVVPDDGSLVPTVPPAVTIAKGDGTFLTVHPTTGSLADVAKAVNDASDAGVKATVVRITNGDTPTYRLQFTGTKTGAENDFAVYAGSEADVAPGARIDTASVREAVDAQITLWKGAGDGIAKEVTSGTNTFGELMAGVSFSVTKVSAAADPPVTVTVGRDEKALETLASDLVAGLNLVLSEIASRTRVTTTTNTDGSTSVTGGLFTGDSGVRNLNQQLATLGSDPVDGKSPSAVGIVVGKDGTFTFDPAKLTAALTADPAAAQAMITKIAERLGTAAKAASEPTTGSLSLKIKGQEDLVKNMGTQIESWDRRLEVRRATLERTYSALEVSLSNLNSQSSWLAGQLASLPSYSS
ncbi:flagellar filament capping protein FliD [Actinotalea ferrariae]|uniref:flagellar filament capping protein FliD n=1 Tax=Actinotalea ferrariae TaxID=1386098 RepID=UPI001C8BF98E|nr:flagellar filament capping protein FliD [Actinotalea ferrariae]MBX9246634.1 flagellar filament capping protein FliD [Actinotalea ferrariae]